MLEQLLSAGKLKQLVTTDDLVQSLPVAVCLDFLIKSVEQHSWVFDLLPDSLGATTLTNSTTYQ